MLTSDKLQMAPSPLKRIKSSLCHMPNDKVHLIMNVISDPQLFTSGVIKSFSKCGPTTSNTAAELSRKTHSSSDHGRTQYIRALGLQATTCDLTSFPCDPECLKVLQPSPQPSPLAFPKEKGWQRMKGWQSSEEEGKKPVP